MAVLHDEAGGSLGSSSASELPRNCHQVYNSVMSKLFYDVTSCFTSLPGLSSCILGINTVLSQLFSCAR